MTDIKVLLELALPSDDRLQDGDDPAADLHRGRALLRRRRLTRSCGAGAAAIVVTGLVAGVAALGGAARHAGPVASHRLQPASNSPASHPARLPHIRLVAYRGTQVPGYQVAEVPTGWTIQGGDPYVLTIAPVGDPNKDIDAFTGKLIVTMEGQPTYPQGAAADPVNGHQGEFWVAGGYQQLNYLYSPGRWVIVQAPATLGWDAAQMAKFAGGVQILGNAQPSKG
jgi:hypothetical protein